MKGYLTSSQILNLRLQTMKLTACVSWDLPSRLMVHAGTSSYIHSLMSRHLFLDWLGTLISWTLSVISSPVQLAVYRFLHCSIICNSPQHCSHSSEGQNSQPENCITVEQMLEARGPWNYVSSDCWDHKTQFGLDMIEGGMWWSSRKLCDTYEDCVSYWSSLCVFVPESFPTNLPIQKTELGVHALKPNHTVPTQEGNWQIQSAWNRCKAESKRSNENISLQPVC